MSENIELNNLDIDLTGVDLSRPLLGRQTLRCLIGDVTAEKDDTSGRQLIVPLILQESGTTTTGNQVNPGFVVIDRLRLDPKGGRTQEMINKQLGQLQAAALKLDDPVLKGPLLASEYPGKEVLVTFDVRADKQDASKQYQDVRRYSAVK